MKSLKEKAIIICLGGLLGYTVITSKSQSGSADLSSSSETQVVLQKSNTKLKSIKHDKSSLTNTESTEDEYYLDPTYLEFAAKRKQFQDYNNRDGAIDAGADPFANTIVSSNLREDDYLETQYAEIAERDENFATEELDWDQYTGSQADEE